MRAVDDWARRCFTLRPGWWRWQRVTHCPVWRLRWWRLELVRYRKTSGVWTGNWLLFLGPFWFHNDEGRYSWEKP